MASCAEIREEITGSGKRRVIIYISKWVSVERQGGSSRGSETDDAGERTFQGQRRLTGKVPAALEMPPEESRWGADLRGRPLRSDVHKRQSSARRSP